METDDTLPPPCPDCGREVGQGWNGECETCALNYEHVYANWDSYKDCRVRIPGERLWGKELPNGLYGISNVPLHEQYRFQDIVRATHLPVEAADRLILHRRWKLVIDYKWAEPEDEAVAIVERQKILDVLGPLGFPGFYMPGYAYLFLEGGTEAEAHKMITTALAGLGVTPNFKVDEEE